MPHRILCVDGDTDARAETVDTLRSALTDLEVGIEGVGTVADAEAALGTDTDAIVTEYELPDGTGFDIVTAAGDICPDAGTVLYTETDPGTLDTTALRGTITEYVGKGSVFGSERLADLVRTTIASRPQGSYPVPQNEADRLAALRSYDLENEALIEALDRITDLAATHFEVEQASINLITEHSQEFLACYGDAAEWERMDREDSICTFTILEDDGVMTVEDVTEDPRFQSRADALVDLGIRAYMGANLVTKRGLVIGPLCVYDDEPRSFTAADEAYLTELATLAMDLIECHARLDAAEDPAEVDR
ncbi:GAF domain-containing protein [Halorhabdus sp. CBA1104]|uniref:GAF domain-containing protein n=1 Tax=Halorhabdus sp. CBA1104 TaxID=1380432 RepID=UPI0012B325AB|nr:GAF domain-containing protein [Halorhabdus sp. CBA1104]QGN06055.1 GAF domain-containing protein [Halorhabdus sp. CBA1104]